MTLNQLLPPALRQLDPAPTAVQKKPEDLEQNIFIHVFSLGFIFLKKEVKDWLGCTFYNDS